MFKLFLPFKGFSQMARLSLNEFIESWFDQIALQKAIQSWAKGWPFFGMPKKSLLSFPSWYLHRSSPEYLVYFQLHSREARSQNYQNHLYIFRNSFSQYEIEMYFKLTRLSCRIFSCERYWLGFRRFKNHFDTIQSDFYTENIIYAAYYMLDMICKIVLTFDRK